MLNIKTIVCGQVGLLLARHCDHYVTAKLRLSDARFAALNQAKAYSEGPGLQSDGSQLIDRSEHDLEGDSSGHSHDQSHSQSLHPAAADLSEPPGVVTAPCECCNGGSLPTGATSNGGGRWKRDTLQRTILESPCPKVWSQPLLRDNPNHQKCSACLLLDLLPTVRALTVASVAWPGKACHASLPPPLPPFSFRSYNTPVQDERSREACAPCRGVCCIILLRTAAAVTIRIGNLPIPPPPGGGLA